MNTAIVCFDLSQDHIATFTDNPAEAHVTLVFLGDVSTLDREAIQERLSEFAGSHAPLDGKMAGIAVLPANADNDNLAPVVALIDSPRLPAFRQALVRLLDGLCCEQNHGFTAHMTLTYTDAEKVHVPTEAVTPSLRFDAISLWWGEEHESYPLAGTTVEKALPIGGSAKATLLKARGAAFVVESSQLAEDVFTGKISIGGWEEAMKALIRGLHTSDAVIGKGGWADMTPSDWGKVGSELKKQYRYLHGFAEDIAANKSTITEGAIRARAAMYGQAAEYTAMLMSDGELIAKLPYMPKDGSTDCLVNCKCRWVFTVISKTKKTQLVRAVWTVDLQAESCETCVDRYGHTELITVAASVAIPPSIPL